MKEEEYEEYGLLEDKGIWLFTGDVENGNCSAVVRWILEENLEPRHNNLTLIINSPGGNVTDGFSVIDAICGSKIPVRTVGIGCLESMGLLMFITGKKGERVLTPNTLIMSHQWYDSFDGKEHELIAGMKRNDLVREMVIRHYKKHTGLNEKEIRKYLLSPSDMYLSAKEAKGLGLCDEVRLV